MVKIVTDSTADLPAGYAGRYGITVVPLKVLFGDTAYRDGVDLTPAQFYEKLRTAPALPTTSQPSPGEFAAVYRELARDGSAVVSIHLSGALSGTAQAAAMGAQAVPEADVTVIDTRSASMGIGFIALEAARAAAAGETKEAVLARVKDAVAGSRVYLVVDTLEYLQKGGRIGRAQALIGGLLNIKPILALRDGVVTPVEKVRGQAKALQRLVEIAAAEVGADTRAAVAIANAANPDGAAALKEKVEATFNNLTECIVSDVGPVIGTHVGPGTLGLLIQTLPAEAAARAEQ